MNRKGCILVADDDPQLRKLVQRNLELAGYKVVVAADGEAALNLAQSEKPDLIVLDILMPGLDGTEVCRRVREFTTAPIIMLTALDDQKDKVAGLDAGADDYLTKPFGSEELLARVRAQLRRARTYTPEVAQPVITAGDLVIDLAQQTATLRGQPLSLTPTEYKILSFLARNAGKVITQQELLRRVWGAEYRDEAHLLRVNIARLRKKIEKDSRSPQYILTRSRIGYTFAGGETRSHRP